MAEKPHKAEYLRQAFSLVNDLSSNLLRYASTGITSREQFDIIDDMTNAIEQLNFRLVDLARFHPQEMFDPTPAQHEQFNKDMLLGRGLQDQ